MQEASLGGNQAFIPHDQTAKMAKPRERALHDPPPAIPPQLPPILMGRPPVIAAGWDNGFDASPHEPRPQGIAILAPIRDQAVGSLARSARLARPADRDRVERLFEEADFRRGRRLQVCSQRSTRAIDQNHPLGALTAFRLADLGAPFFAGTKLPSAKHSSQRIFSWSLSWAKRARQSVSSTPASPQRLSRRQQVLGLPYRRGSSLHWAPVQRIQRMPSKQRRSGIRGRPPRGATFGAGRWTRMAAHCCWVSPRHAMSCSPFLSGNSWRYDTPIGRS
jgi:hypothetical protein